jgi:hypothetical protein
MNLHEEISKVAYELYEKSGRIEGRDLDNWLEAERIVLQRLAEQAKSLEEGITEPTTIEEIPVEPFPKVVEEKPKKTTKKTAKKTTAKKTTRKKKGE